MNRSPRIPRSVWEAHKDTIERVYMTDNGTLQLLSEGMAAIHGFEVSDKQYRNKFIEWGFVKNNRPDEVPGNDRRRVAQQLPKPAHTPFRIVVSWKPRPPRFRWYSEEERQLWRIKVATDTIVKSSFGSTQWKGKWTPDNFSFFESPIGLTLSYQWRSVESLCTAITDLSGNGILSFIKRCLELLFCRIKDLEETLSKPSFLLQMVYIWRICLNLTKIRLPLPRYKLPNLQYPISIHPLAPSFLQRLERKLATKFGRGDPACEIISSLLFIFRSSPQRFKTALQLAYQINIKVFENILGPNNNMVIKMWSHYGRVCGRTLTLKLESTESICERFTTYIEKVGEQATPQSLCYLSGLAEMAIAESSQNIGNLSQYMAIIPKQGDPSLMEDIIGLPSEKDRPDRLEDIITKLRHMAIAKLQAPGGLKDSLAIDVLVYTTKLLALELYCQLNSSHSLELLDDAIKLLHQEGTDSMFWASTLSKERLRLLVREKQYQKVEDEKLRLSTIRHKFPLVKLIRSSGNRGTTKAENARFLRQEDLLAKKELCRYLEMLYHEVRYVGSGMEH